MISLKSPKQRKGRDIWPFNDRRRFKVSVLSSVLKHGILLSFLSVGPLEHSFSYCAGRPGKGGRVRLERGGLRTCPMKRQGTMHSSRVYLPARVGRGLEAIGHAFP